MKIKTTKQMRLDELIKYVWENDRVGELHRDNFGAEVHFNGAGTFSTDDYISSTSVFSVSTEEELAEEMEFKELWQIIWNEEIEAVRAIPRFDKSVEGISGNEYVNTLAIFYKDTLIWSKDTGIPAEGVIEL